MLQAETKGGPQSTAAGRRGGRTLIRVILFAAVLGAVGVGSFYAWKYFSAYEDTDDAQVDGHINAISARINGYVLEVPVDNERYVKAGDVLARIDPRDFTVALAQAEADLAASRGKPRGLSHRCTRYVDHHQQPVDLDAFWKSGRGSGVAGRPASVERGAVASGYCSG